MEHKTGIDLTVSSRLKTLSAVKSWS